MPMNKTTAPLFVVLLAALAIVAWVGFSNLAYNKQKQEEAREAIYGKK
jgi:hypothetical protein